MTTAQRVVIIGGGFGGLHTAKSLRNTDVHVTLIDRRNFHLFQPLLYQVATGALSPANIAAPLRDIFKRQMNTEVLLGEVVDFDVEKREVILRDGRIPYDTLVLAAGVRHHYFGNDQWEEHAPGLKTIEDATEMRRRILLAFEAAERETDPEEIRKWLTFVVIGAGPTGVELAGAVGEIANYTLKNNFRRINPASAKVILVEGMDRVLPPYPADLSAAAQKSLEKLGVTVRTKAMVKDVQADKIIIGIGETDEVIDSHTILWGAGVQGSPLGRKLAAATGAELDRAGRIIVQPDLSLPNHPEILVIGDLAHYAHQTGKPLPGVAQVAMQSGDYAARLIKARLKGETVPTFHYRDLGNMATIGRAAAVADLGKLHFTGFIGWVLWLFIHLLYIVQYQSRILVLIQWAWNYITRNRAARLITGEHRLPPADHESQPPQAEETREKELV
ncbi:MAG: NAD(P)/FAD-dependent oxidoreductase [Chloroflexi bacterium]|nr:NAD(P)/FAD-dependent oxidoreductase [Chloroflexota bacterium]MCC6896025.1 NAD(P)/FAD-dependent oxidoreductase [Anaerolineae bacterium]